jgi:transglutaminase-like putative cysteine protease
MTKSDTLKSRHSFLIAPFNALISMILLQLLSHYNHLPLWLVWFCLALTVYGFFTYKMVVQKVSLMVRTLLVVLSVVIFFMYYKLNLSVDMAASFLVLASTLKFLEIKSKKDVTIFVYVMLYLSAISFLFVQSFVHAVLQFIFVLVSLYVLLCVNSSQGLLKYQAPLSSLFKAALVAGPIVLVFFLFFPRIAPLWSIPIKAKNATTGMTNFMSPGDIAELAQSSERAFRATFSLKAPEKKDLYWRGLVLDQFDGRAWSVSNAHSLQQGFNKVDLGVLYDHGDDYYEVMLEPNNQSWVYALESSRVSSSNVLVKEAGQFQLKTDAIQSTRYKMTFKSSEAKEELAIPTAKILQKNAGITEVSKGVRSYLKAPVNSNHRTQQYIKDLQVSFPNKIDLINHLMNKFSEQSYYYTLKPSVLGLDTVDEFLFDTKQGFCAHYASSLAYMLRLAKIPARVIAGYQGGEYNQQGGYYIVHQYDAHAWVEVQLAGIGWVRLDPTAMVAPERILSGLNIAVGDQGGFLNGSPIASAVLKISGLNWLRLRADEFNYKWQKLVVNYGNNEQESFVNNLFKDFMPKTDRLLRVVVVLGGLFALLISMVLFYLWYKPYAGRYTYVEKIYMLWLYVLVRLSGLKRITGETPNAFLLRVKASNYKRLAKVTEKITAKLEQDQYRIQ